MAICRIRLAQNQNKKCFKVWFFQATLLEKEGTNKNQANKLDCDP